MTENTYLTQTQLAERWQVAESTLERWRSEGIVPIYMKMMGRVRYRLSAVTVARERHGFGPGLAGVCVFPLVTPVAKLEAQERKALIGGLG